VGAHAEWLRVRASDVLDVHPGLAPIPPHQSPFLNHPPSFHLFRLLQRLLKQVASAGLPLKPWHQQPQRPEYLFPELSSHHLPGSKQAVEQLPASLPELVALSEHLVLVVEKELVLAAVHEVVLLPVLEILVLAEELLVPALLE
jgi:hypothetical protein